MRGRQRRPGQRHPYPAGEHRAQRIDADLQVVGRALLVACQDRTGRIDQHEFCLAAAAIDSQVGVHGLPDSG